MKYLIDEDDLSNILTDVLLDGNNNLLDNYKKCIEWVNNTPNIVINQNDYIGKDFENINDAEDFKQEMIIRINCLWIDQVIKKLNNILFKYDCNGGVM